MIGLIVAAIYVGIVTLLNGGSYVPTAVHDVAGYGFWWHCVWAVLTQCIIAGVALLAVVSTVASLAMEDSTKAGATFAAGCGSLIVLACCFPVALLTSAAWIVVDLLVYYSAPETLGSTFLDWDWMMLGFASVLALVVSYAQSKCYRSLSKWQAAINREKKAALA